MSNKKIAEVGKTALAVAGILLSPSLTILGVAAKNIMSLLSQSSGLLISFVDWDKDKNNRIAKAVEKALIATRDAMQTQTKKAIVNELIDAVKKPGKLDKRIKNGEAYRIHSETPMARREIEKAFKNYFERELLELQEKYPDLALLLNEVTRLDEIIATVETSLKEQKITLDDLQCHIKGMEETVEGVMARMASLEETVQHVTVQSRQTKRPEEFQNILALFQSAVSGILQKGDPALALPHFKLGVRLIGREDALSEFHARFAKDGEIAIISAIGGVGKTEFVKAYGKAHQEEYSAFY